MNSIYFRPLLLLLFIFNLSSISSKSHTCDDKARGNPVFFSSTSKSIFLKAKYRIFSSPKFTVQISGGMNLGVSELYSNHPEIFNSEEFTSGRNFGVRGGYGVTAMGKLPIQKSGGLRFTFSTSFNRFQNNFLADDSPSGNVKYNVLSFGLGLENSFNPAFRLKPYIAVGLDANIINGKANLISNNNTRTVTIKNSFRIGYTVYTGFEYMFNKNLGANVGARFSNLNQILKSSEDSDNQDEIPLRDKKSDIDPKPEFSGHKNFTFAALYIGLNFYFGIKEKIYKF